MRPADPSETEQTLLGLAKKTIGDAMKNAIIAALGTLAIAAASLVSRITGIGVNAESWWIPLALALIVLGFSAGIPIGSLAESALSETIERYRYVRLYNKTRKEWPPAKSLIFRGEGEIWPSGRVIIRVLVTNVGHVEWILTDATIPPNSFIVAYGIHIPSPLVWVPTAEVAIDQGQSAWLVFEGHASIPSTAVLDINQGHYGVIGQTGNAFVRVCSMDDRTPIIVPILNLPITGHQPLTIFIQAHQ